MRPPAMSLEEALRVLQLEGYPTTLAADELAMALRDAPHEAPGRAALEVVRDFLAGLRDSSPPLQAAYDQLDWAAGSPTELLALRSQLGWFGSLEVAEAARIGAPRGAALSAKPALPRTPAAPEPPHAPPHPTYLGTSFKDLYARATGARPEDWERMQEAFDAAIDVPAAPAPPAGECIALALRLHAMGDFDAADALTTTFARWLDAGGAAPSGVPTRQWRVARELACASPTFLPQSLRTPLAEAALADDLGLAAPAIRRAAVGLSDDDRAALDGLEADAPTLAKTIRAAAGRGNAPE